VVWNLVKGCETFIVVHAVANEEWRIHNPRGGDAAFSEQLREQRLSGRIAVHCMNDIVQRPVMKSALVGIVGKDAP